MEFARSGAGSCTGLFGGFGVAQSIRKFCFAGARKSKAFLRRKWAKELDYRLKKTLCRHSMRIGLPLALSMQVARCRWAMVPVVWQ